MSDGDVSNTNLASHSSLVFNLRRESGWNRQVLTLLTPFNAISPVISPRRPTHRLSRKNLFLEQRFTVESLESTVDEGIISAHSTYVLVVMRSE